VFLISAPDFRGGREGVDFGKAGAASQPQKGNAAKTDQDAVETNQRHIRRAAEKSGIEISSDDE
jgi:hypothetical protein